MVNKLKAASHFLFEGLLPQHCALCGLFSHSPLPLCEPCQREMPLNTSHCPCCALPLPQGSLPVLCGRCQQRRPAFERAAVPLLYGEYLAYLIQQWKYNGQQRFTPLLASLWLHRSAVATPDLLVPIPMHWSRQLRRGYNQTELLARALVSRAPALGGVKVDIRLLRRNRATAAQSGMDARARVTNLRGAFTVRRRCDSLRIALVDDVMTTGATADAAASALLDAGAAGVEIWCLARTPID